MKIRNDNKIKMNKELYLLLNELRKKRKFIPELYLKIKTEYINEYLKTNNINTCIIGISGGIDSCLSLALLNECKNNNDNLKIIPFVIPNLTSKGVSNQKIATKDGKKIIKFFNLQPNQIKMDKITKKIFKEISKNKFNMKIDDWSIGQSIAYLRTTLLYSITSVTTFDNNKSLLIGTTNRDEGCYIGYFGKASDGMVDLQIISDLHKSEVYTMAKYLNIPDYFIKRTPTGDLYDNKSDEELFGFSYDFLELYLLLNENINKYQYINNFNQETFKIYNILKENVEKLHNYNKHKYFVGSPAVHLDIYQSNFKNGWNNKKYIINKENFENKNKNFVNPVETNIKFNDFFVLNKNNIYVEQIKETTILHNFFNNNEIKILNSLIENKKFIPVGINGYKEDYKEGDKIGNYRLSLYNETLSKIIFNRLKEYLEPIYEFDNTLTDSGNSRYWKPEGLNPLFRFIKYKKEGFLIPHYDSPYIKNENNKTLYTVIISLSNMEEKYGGATRFIKDKEKYLDINEKNLEDKESILDNKNIDYKIYAKKGDLIIFPHRLLHDSEIIKEHHEKNIIRTDILFERVF